MAAFPEMRNPHEWQRVGDIVVSFTGPGEIADPLWDLFVAALGEKGVRVALGLTSDDTAGINATQRKAVADVMKRNNIAAYAVTNSRVLRGVLTAVSWLGSAVKGYAWDDLDAAIAATGADAKQQAEIRAMANTFRKKVMKG